MDFALRRAGARVEIDCGQRLDADSVAAFRPVADSALAETGAEIVLRCERLATLDSSGVGAIVYLHRRLAQQGRRLRLAGLDGQPLALARMIGLDAALGLARSEAKAATPRGGLAARLRARLLALAGAQPREA